MNENDDEKDKNKLHYPTFENSSIDLNILLESYEDFDIAASERRKTNGIQKHVSASHVKPESSGLTTLNMREVKEPLPFEEDEETTMISFQEKTVFDLHERRKKEKEKL